MFLRLNHITLKTFHLERNVKEISVMNKNRTPFVSSVLICHVVDFSRSQLQKPKEKEQLS